MFKEKCHSQAQKGMWEVKSVSLGLCGSCHNVLIFFSNFRDKIKHPKKKIAIATEKDPGTPHSQPLHGFKTRKKNEPNRSNAVILRKVTLFGSF